MDQSKTNVYKKRLEADKEKLLKDLAAAEATPDFGNDIDGLDEEADEAEEIANDLAAAQAIRERVSEIDAALNNIATGKYGICKKCGGEISERVLDLVPESRLCAKCKLEK